MRSCWKTKIIYNKYLDDSNLTKNIYSRNARIPEYYLGKRVNIHNGKRFISILIKSFMLHKRFGEFILTKVLGSKIHAKIKLKLKLRKNKKKK